MSPFGTSAIWRAIKTKATFDLEPAIAAPVRTACNHTTQNIVLSVIGLVVMVSALAYWLSRDPQQLLPSAHVHGRGLKPPNKAHPADLGRATR